MMATAIAMGAFGLQLGLGASAFSYILLFVALVYAVTSPLVYRHAANLVQAAT